MMDEIRPCVVCGEARIIQLRPPRGIWSVECRCGNVSSSVKHGAIEKWETRQVLTEEDMKDDAMFGRPKEKL
jgi:hypothetical protein